MTGKKESGATWHPTTVVLREDIYRQALEQGIDISDACNRAIASLTGSEYPRQQREEVPPPPPVIIARAGSSPHAPGELKKSPLQKLHPVINADDPAAPARVVQAKAQPLKKPLRSPRYRFLHRSPLKKNRSQHLLQPRKMRRLKKAISHLQKRDPKEMR